MRLPGLAFLLNTYFDLVELGELATKSPRLAMPKL